MRLEIPIIVGALGFLLLTGGCGTRTETPTPAKKPGTSVSKDLGTPAPLRKLSVVADTVRPDPLPKRVPPRPLKKEPEVRCPAPGDHKNTIRYGSKRDFPVKLHSLFITREGSHNLAVNLIGKVRNLSQTVLVNARLGVSFDLTFKGYCLGNHQKFSLGPAFHNVRPPISTKPGGQYRGRPWRHREWRGFNVSTPALKGSLKFLRTGEGRVTLALNSADWLCYRFSSQLLSIPVRWDSLLGIRVDGQATISKRSIISGVRRYKVDRGQRVRLLFQRDRFFRIRTANGSRGWIDARRLVIDDLPGLYRRTNFLKGKKSVALSGQLGFSVRKVEAVRYHPGIRIRAGERLLVLHTRLTNKSSDEWRCKIEKNISLDIGRRLTRPLVTTDVKSALKCDKMAPGETRSGKLFFRLRPTWLPFYVGIKSPAGKAILEVDVFEARWRTALLRDGLERRGGGAERFRLKVSQAYLVDNYPSLYSTGFSIAGRIRNLTRRTLTSVKLKPVLNLVKSDNPQVCGRFSSNRRTKRPYSRITPRVDTKNPWRPGEWRSFAADSLRVNKLFRDISFKKVIGTMSISAEGPFCYGLSPTIFRTEYSWRSLFGTRVSGRGKVVRGGTLFVDLGKRTRQLTIGDRFVARYQKGHWFFVQLVGGASGWVHAKSIQFNDLASLYLPGDKQVVRREVQSPSGFRLRVLSVRPKAGYEGVSVKSDEGLYVIRVQLTNNTNGEWKRCDLKRMAYLDYGGRSRRYPSLVSDGFGCSGLAVGQSRSGELVFKRGRYDIPFGLYMATPSKESLFLHLYSHKFNVLVDKLNEDVLERKHEDEKQEIN